MKLSQCVTHERLARLCLIDYAQEMALIAEYEDPQSRHFPEHLVIAEIASLTGRVFLVCFLCYNSASDPD
jgi:acetyltransferase